MTELLLRLHEADLTADSTEVWQDQVDQAGGEERAVEGFVSRVTSVDGKAWAQLAELLEWVASDAVVRESAEVSDFMSVLRAFIDRAFLEGPGGIYAMLDSAAGKRAGVASRQRKKERLAAAGVPVVTDGDLEDAWLSDKGSPVKKTFRVADAVKLPESTVRRRLKALKLYVPRSKVRR